MLRFYTKLASKSAFPRILSLEHELKKAGLIRFFLGMLMLVRFAEINDTFRFLDFGSGPVIFSSLFLVLILCFTLGFLTPLSNLLLMCLCVRMDLYFGTFTLGTSILMVTLLPLLLVNSGQFYSVDRWILKRGGVLSKFIAPFYKWVGALNEADMHRAYFLSFVCYAIISFGALLLHVQDIYWVEGLTTKSLLLNSYLCKHYNWFRFIDLHAPYLLSVLSISAGVLQSIFQFLMIPLMFFRIGSRFVFFWGMLFFLISLFFINLSYLPPIEILLWLLILGRVDSSRSPIRVLYDDHCNLCKRAMRFLKFLNFNGRIVFSAISTNKELVSENNLSEKEVKAYMVGFRNGKIYKGYDLYYQIFKINPLFWPLLPVFLLALITRVGHFVYNFIAERRYRLFGQCELSFGDEIAAPTPILQERSARFFTSFVYFYYSLMLLLYLLIRMPHVREVVPKPAWLEQYGLKTLIYSGFDLPNVFNKTDLSMGDNWVEIYRKENDGWKLVPLTGAHGERLNYRNADLFNLTNHNSDKLYFGNTLQVRRGLILTDVNEFMQEKSRGWYLLRMTLNYDLRMNSLNEPQKYMVLVYRNSTSIVSHGPPTPGKYDKRLVFHAVYLYDGKTMAQTSF